MAFRKPGRPRDGRLVRQREIYLAAVPLLKRDRVRGLSMREVACAAYMSVGSLYYYFPSKRALVLHGVQPEALTRFCQEDACALAHLAATDLPAYRQAFLDHVYRLVSQFVLPAYDAAVELGLETMLAEIRHTLDQSVAAMIPQLQPLLPHLDESRLEAMSAGMHRLLLGALLDRSTTPEHICGDLDALIAGYGAVPARTTPPSETVENVVIRSRASA